MTRFASVTVVLLFAGCGHVTEDPQKITINTPDGQVTAHRAMVQPTPQTITVVVGDELAWLQSLGKDGPRFVAHYVPGAVEPTLKDYDHAFRAWQSDRSPSFDDQQVIQIVGAYLGNKLVAELEMEWVTVSDEYGTDYAVRSHKVEVMSFPFSTVRRRIEDEEYDFVHGVYYTTKEMLTNREAKVRERPKQ